jgi:selenocysteine lyase/cysteine desulfurase
MPHTVRSLALDPANSLAPSYSRFRVEERVLLTGHSHQAWPDVGFAAQQQAWLDAAQHVDDKWPRAFAQAAAVRRGFARLLGEQLRAANYALGASTHDLLVRFLSALPLRQRPRLVSTDGEFHSLRRQLDRLAEEPLDVVRVPAEPVSDLAGRLCAAIDDGTAAVLVSAVMFRNGRIVPGLGQVAERAARHGCELFVDAYHALGAMPFDLEAQGLGQAFVTGGGYKYCQLGEGNCFLRVPDGCRLRPVITGWYAEFDRLEAKASSVVGYAEGGSRFAGSTYDPTSHYRGAAVFEFFRAEGLTPELLRDVSQRQLARLRSGIEALDPDPRRLRLPDAELGELGGFLTLESPVAGLLAAGLKRRGIWADHRDDALRLGPAPYLAAAQLDQALEALRETLAELPPSR